MGLINKTVALPWHLANAVRGVFAGGGQPAPDDDFWFSPLFGGTGASNSGVYVTPQRAMQAAAVYACVRIIAETIGSLPVVLYRGSADGKVRERAKDHPLYRILHDRPNELQTPITFKETLTGHVALRGTGYAEIIEDARGNIAELIPLHPDCVEVRLLDRRRVGYLVRDSDGRQRPLTQGQVMRIPGFSDNGVTGLSPIAYHRETIGLTLAADAYGARFFANDSQPRGVIKHPAAFKSNEQLSEFKDQWREMHSRQNQHSMAVLQHGMEYQSIGMTNDEAQFLDTRKYQVSDIARIFRLPPHMVGDLEKATFSNIEQQAIEFVVHSVRPWAVRWEQAIKRDLLDGDDPDLFVKVTLDALLRGDIETRNKAYSTGRQWGWLSRNDVREMEDKNPIENGDDYLTPINMTAGDPDQARASGNGSSGGAAAADQRSAAMLQVAVDRVAAKEIGALRRAHKKAVVADKDAALNSFSAEVDRFYKAHADFAARVLFIPNNMAAAWCRDQWAAVLAAGQSEISSGEADVGRLLDEWEIDLAARLFDFVTGVWNESDDC